MDWEQQETQTFLGQAQEGIVSRDLVSQADSDSNTENNDRYQENQDGFITEDPKPQGSLPRPHTLHQIDDAVPITRKKDQLPETLLKAMMRTVTQEYEQIPDNQQQDGTEHQRSEVELERKTKVEEGSSVEKERKITVEEDSRRDNAAREELKRMAYEAKSQWDAEGDPKAAIEEAKRIHDEIKQKEAIARGRSQSRSRSRSRGRRSSPVQLGLPSQPPVPPGQEGSGPRIEEVEERLRSQIELGEIKPNVAQGANWTKISCETVNPEALVIGKERFEVQDDFVIVLRALSKEEIQAYASATVILRGMYFFSSCCCCCCCCCKPRGS